MSKTPRDFSTLATFARDSTRIFRYYYKTERLLTAPPLAARHRTRLFRDCQIRLLSSCHRCRSGFEQLDQIDAHTAL